MDAVNPSVPNQLPPRTPPQNRRVEACRACGSPDLEELFGLGDHFLNDFPLPGEERAGLRCPIEIVQCRACTLVQQRWSAPPELLYSGGYWYRSGVTQTMRAALRDVAEQASKLVKLEPGDVVLDIGSNDGTLLRCYPEDLVRVGVEPANNLATSENYEGLTLIHDFWNEESYRKGMGDENANR